MNILKQNSSKKEDNLEKDGGLTKNLRFFTNFCIQKVKGFRFLDIYFCPFLDRATLSLPKKKKNRRFFGIKLEASQTDFFTVFFQSQKIPVFLEKWIR
jgi:hypothetical protein